MRLLKPWAFFFLRFGLVLIMAFLIPASGWAEESVTLENRPSKGTATVHEKPPQSNSRQELQEMRAEMSAMRRDYSRQMQQMQETIRTLSAQVTRLGGDTTAVNSPAPAVGQSSLEDQDIGHVLIFEPDEKKSIPPSLSFENRQTGWDIQGRSPLNSLTQPFSTNGSWLGQSMNPDIIVAGDFLGNFASQSMPDRNRVALREAEFGFSAAIDPYAKGTFIFSKPEHSELEVEEGYATLLALPYGLQAKVGKMRSPFGKINLLHTHDLPQTDRPDVYTRFFGEDGLIESGVALSRLLPTPWYSSVDVQVANGETPPLFGRDSMVKPLTVGRWKNFFELTDTQSLELGLSGALGARGHDDRNRLSGVEGVDMTYRWLPANQYHAFIWQTEFLTAQREHPFTGANNGLYGGYSFVEYKLNNRWSAGIRMDYTQVPEIAHANEWAIAPYINFWESEFGRWRLGYKHTFGDSHIRSNDQAWLQYTVILGLHPPHTF